MTEERMTPGRELDALVVEKVFGCDVRTSGEVSFCGCAGSPHGKPVVYGALAPLRCYSTDIAAAWEVVERFRDVGISVMQPGERPRGNPDRKWVIYIGYDDEQVEETADTAPHAICLAALKAVGASETSEA